LEVFVKLFIAHFEANKTKPLETADLFELKQSKEEFMKPFLRRFNEVVAQIPMPNEGMCVEAFIRGLQAGKFGESLVRKRLEDMATVNIRATSHIKVEEFTRKKMEEEMRVEGPQFGTQST